MKKNKTTRRKLQFAGNSSYVLTLPKPWIVNVGLDNENAEVLIEELPDATVRIIPSHHENKQEVIKPQEIRVSKNRTKDEIIRLILASYLASKPKIILKAVGDLEFLPSQLVIAVNNVCQKLWGSEIVEETGDQIIIQDALNASQMGIKDIIDKAWFTAKNMLNRAFEAVFTKDNQKLIMENASMVTNSENTLDKLYYLSLRQLYKASSNMLFASEIGILPKDIIDYHLLIKNIERIGDHSEQLVQNINKEFENLEDIKRLSELSQQACELAIDSFQKHDEKKAQEAINFKKLVINEAEKISFTFNELPLSKSILRITDYASDIGELVLNRFVSNLD